MRFPAGRTPAGRSYGAVLDVQSSDSLAIMFTEDSYLKKSLRSMAVSDQLLVEFTEASGFQVFFRESTDVLITTFVEQQYKLVVTPLKKYSSEALPIRFTEYSLLKKYLQSHAYEDQLLADFTEETFLKKYLQRKRSEDLLDIFLQEDTFLKKYQQRKKSHEYLFVHLDEGETTDWRISDLEPGNLRFDGLISVEPTFGIDYWRSMRRQLLPNTRDNTMIVPGKDGEYHFRRDVGSGEIVGRFYLFADSPANLRLKSRAISRWLHVREPKELIFGDEPDKYYLAIPAGPINPEEIANMAEATIHFSVPDGFAHALDKDVASTESGALTVYNDGVLPTPMTVRLIMNQNVDDVKVEVQETGEFILLQKDIVRWNQSLLVGDVVEIDTEKHLVTVNGVDARPGVNYLSSYPKVPLVYSTITVDKNALMTVEFRKRYL